MLCLPWLHWQPQKTSVPHRVQSWRANVLAQICGFAHVLSQAIQDSRYGRSFACSGGAGGGVQSGSGMPMAALPPPPHCSLSERSRHVEGLTALHDVSSPAPLWATALMATTGSVGRSSQRLMLRCSAHRKRRFDEGPGRCRLPHLVLPFSFSAAMPRSRAWKRKDLLRSDRCRRSPAQWSAPAPCRCRSPSAVRRCENGVFEPWIRRGSASRQGWPAEQSAAGAIVRRLPFLDAGRSVVPTSCQMLRLIGWTVAGFLSRSRFASRG